jgi:hypothetical protein
MPTRKLPVRPDLRQLKRQAKDLLRALRKGDPDAIEELAAHHPTPPDEAKLADAQLVLARSYQATSWPRLVRACELIDAIWRDDVDEVMRLVIRYPELLHEHATIRDSNWGPPLTYAANLGRDRIIRMLHELGARDTEWALGRAVLQGKIATARLLHEMLGSPEPPDGALAGAAYTLSVSGTAFAFEIGARIVGPEGVDGNTIEHLLGTDSRNPAAKHRILEMYVEHGLEPPETPVMALHRGRIDLLERHLERDPDLLTRTFDVTDVFPPSLGCRTDVFARYVAQGTPVHGTTLLHIAAYFDELEIAEWLLSRGMDPDARAAVDEDGFGGYTALFSAVVSQRNFWINYGKGQKDEARFTRLLLDRGADPNVRASLRARLEEGHGGGPLREYRDVTPLRWGKEYHARIFVGRESLRLIKARGGRR